MPRTTLDEYANHAKVTSCPVCRTVNMLGMQCAAAMHHRGLLAFVGEGRGGDWPDPRKDAPSASQPGTRRPPKH